jgi:Sulfotransferase domain
MRRGEDTERIDDTEMARLFARHLSQIESWLARQPQMDVLYVHYSDVLATPAAQAARVNAFLGGGLDERRMAEVVDPELYRQKK